jgi:hypothetical protein
MNTAGARPLFVLQQDTNEVKFPSQLYLISVSPCIDIGKDIPRCPLQTKSWRISVQEVETSMSCSIG